MFKTEVTLLRKDNIEQFKALALEDRQIIMDIMSGISIFKVNTYDIQVIQRDLIGMAQELRMRNSNLQEAIGGDIRSFVDEVVKNSAGPSGIELLLSFLSRLSVYFFASFLYSSLVTSGGLIWSGYSSIFLRELGMVLILFIAEGLLAPLFINKIGFQKRFHLYTTFALLAGWVVIMHFFIDRNNRIDINVKPILLAAANIFAVAQYLRKLNISRLAKGKKNYIQDLL